VRVLLVSTYDLGRQPFGLASPAAWLREAGYEVRCVDAAKTPLAEADVRRARLVAFHLPMHTATRLAGPWLQRVRRWNPDAHLCGYGLYAPLNEAWLRSLGVATILGAEFEADLVALAGALERGDTHFRPAGTTGLPRLRFRTPDRSDLPALTAYAALQAGDARRTAGYTEASRGCQHRCRHCPIVPIYNGRFRIVPSEVVLADVRAQVAAGARHITFGDPDFFNGIRHALRIVSAFAREFPGVSYDVTIKIEHLLHHARHLRTLVETGCAFVTSAVESVDDRILEILQKGHTREDFVRVAALCRETDLVLSPTFVAFTPWTTLGGYGDLLDTIEALGLVDHVAPIQLAIRLLVPAGSRLLEVPELRAFLHPFDAATLAYPWSHPDPRVDALQRDVATVVGRRLTASRREVFDAIAGLVRDDTGRRRVERPASRPGDARPPLASRATVPYLTEPWYC
jgi:radical SAM superfamily enzyme YgiQ (UPF0313 family)